MIYDSEIVRKNMKYMRELYGIKQTELAEVLHITQHGLSQYETGERKLKKYEFVQTLANYFRIPVEQFVKEDLSEIISFRSINEEVAELKIKAYGYCLIPHLIDT